MNILFRTSGGINTKRELGFGHIYRCINLSSYFKRNKIFFLVEDNGGVKSIFRERKIPRVSYLESAELNSDIKSTRESIIKNKIDVLIVDVYGLSLEYLVEIRKNTKVVVISDLMSIDFPADLVINGFIGFKNKIRQNRLGVKCVLGPAYQILDKNFRKKINVKKKYDLLITFGGYDDNSITEIALSLLLKYPNLTTKVILGPATKMSKKIKNLEKDLGDRVKIIKQTRRMNFEMAQCRFGLCSGGLTTYEFASMHIPFAVISQVKHQLITANSWEKMGLAKNLGLFNKQIKKRIDEYLREISEIPKSSTNYSKLFHQSNGINTIIREISKINN